MKKGILYVPVGSDNPNWLCYGIGVSDATVDTDWTALTATDGTGGFLPGNIAVDHAIKVNGTVTPDNQRIVEYGDALATFQRGASSSLATTQSAIYPGSYVDPVSGALLPNLRTTNWPALAAASTTAIHASIALSGSTQTITTGISNPTVARNVTITGGAVGMAGNVHIIGTYQGLTVSEDIALSGTSTVAGVNVYDTITSIGCPVQTNPGDTVTVGTGVKIGLGAALPANTVVLVTVDGTQAAVGSQTINYSASKPEQTYITFATAPNGTHNYRVAYIQV